MATDFSFTMENDLTMPADMEPRYTTLRGMPDVTLPSLEGPSPTDAVKGLRGDMIPGAWCRAIALVVSGFLILGR